MSARLRMTMRTTIRRNVAAFDTDAYNQPVAGVYEDALTDVPCFVWSTGKRVADGRSTNEAARVKSAVIEDVRALFPLGTDITERDRLGDITDRLGNVLFPGEWAIPAVQRKFNHLMVSLERVS